MARFYEKEDLQAGFERAQRQLGASSHRYTEANPWEVVIADKSIERLDRMALLSVWDGERFIDLARLSLFEELDSKYSTPGSRIHAIHRYRQHRAFGLKMIREGLAS